MKRNLTSVRDRSGSCAVVLLVTPSKVYCANVGDSRALYSRNFGSDKISMSYDHKPSEQAEKNRIIAAGGKVYQSNAMNPNAPRGLPILGPMRVMPGRLSVSLNNLYLNSFLIISSLSLGFKNFRRLYGQNGEIWRQSKMYHCRARDFFNHD